MKGAAIGLLVATVVVLAAPGAATAKTNEFQTPSHNIVCRYSSSGGPGALIRCDVLSLNDVGFLLERRKRAKRIRVTDTAGDTTKARILRYGTARRFGPFRCASRTSGLTCRSRTSSHGFTLSRRRQRVF
jgi:hypothetical protein